MRIYPPAAAVFGSPAPPNPPATAKPAGPESSEPAKSTLPLALAAGRAPFDERLLTALLSTQAYGTMTPAHRRLANLAAGEAPMVIGPGEFHARPGASAFVTEGGTLDAAELQGWTPQTVAHELVAAFGSGGRLALEDVEDAAMTGAAGPEAALGDVRANIAVNWNALSGNASYLSADALANVLSRYWPPGAGVDTRA